MKTIAYFLLSGLFAGGCVESASSSAPPTSAERASTQPVVATTLPTKMARELTPPETRAVSTAEKMVAVDPRTANWGKVQSVYQHPDGGYIVNFGTSYVGPRNVLVHEDKAEVLMAR